MRKLYNYCFYKTAHFYERTEGDGLFSGTLLTAGAGLWVILAFINIILALFFHFSPKRPFYVVYSIISVIIIFYISHKYDTEDKYLSLCEEYGHEKHARLKGWLVLLCILLSFSLLFVSFMIQDLLVKP